MEKKGKSKKSKMLVEIFDSMFIMLLCFGTLLTAMLMQGESSELTYVINFKTLAITVIGLVVYLVFVLSQSEKGLKSMVNHIYSDKENKEVDKK